MAQQDHDLAADVDPLEVVVFFGLGRDPVSGEHQRPIEARRTAGGQRQEVLANGQLDGLRLLAWLQRRTDQREAVLFAKLGRQVEGEFLERSALGPLGLQSGLGKLPGDEFGRQVEPFGADAASFQLVRGQIAHGIAQPLFDLRRLFGHGPQQGDDTEQRCQREAAENPRARRFETVGIFHDQFLFLRQLVETHHIAIILPTVRSRRQ